MSYTLIERKELTEAASSISFDNIPQFYSDLQVLVSGRSDRNVFGFTVVHLSFNDSSSGYTHRSLQGTGSAVNSFSQADTVTNGIVFGAVSQANNTSNTFGNGSAYIPNYTGSTNKSVSCDGVNENNATEAAQLITAGVWSVTDAITKITLRPWQFGFFNWVSGSSISLYGINRQQAIGAPKAVGGAISFANGHWVHTFTGSGTFYPQEDIECQYLVVAGGGGGMYDRGGGGGAGGYRSSVNGELSGGNTVAEPTIKLTGSTGLQVLVGSGGSAGTSYEIIGTRGGNSSLGSITSVGGGFGGGGTAASSGGSGGGAFGQDLGVGNLVGGAATAGQGFAGGNGIGPSLFHAAGGGGAGAAGANAGSNAGNGGAGLSSSINGTLTFRAGGGGGGANAQQSGSNGTGGIGGGGNGGRPGANGTALTGGGGGGGTNNPQAAGGSGGSGIVIIRYKA